eukprot:Em0002g342a
MSTDTRVNSSSTTDSTFSTDGPPILTDGPPILTDGPPILTDGTSMYIAIDGASILSNIKRISTDSTRISINDTPTFSYIQRIPTAISTPIISKIILISTDDTPIFTDGTIITDIHTITNITDTSIYHELAHFLKDIINSTMFHKKYSVYAVYRLEDTSKPKDLPFEEVAFGSGTQWEKRITRDSKVNLEDIIWDSHAEVIANQSFRRYLISQMKNLISGTKESIFEYDRSSSSSTNTVPSSPLPCLKLRSNFRIHLYISKVPCGGAAHCLRSATDGTPISTEGTPISTEGTPNSTDGTPIWDSPDNMKMHVQNS